ncbi:MAG TPA: type II toxin-antitoxin system PemK/MazF family toxin [Acidobacteriota bacterium]
MERINRGEIWIIQPLGHPKPRPALVISINPINDLCPDVLLVPITTKAGPLRVLLADQPALTGLKTKSHAKCESLGPVHKSRLKKRIGRVQATDLAKIEEGIKKVLGL